MNNKHLNFSSVGEEKLIKELEKRNDPESNRIKRFLAMPDLTRKEGSPLKEMTDRILAIPDFKDFHIVQAPEINPTDISFDLFDFPADHPVRSRSDTYYIGDDQILRTHTTVMWYYYFTSDLIKEKVKNKESFGALSFGKVYRKDEIDRHHMNVFHQMDGVYLAPRNKETIGTEDLQNVLAMIAKAIYGENIKYRFNEDKFPYTDPSLEMEVEIGPSAGSPRPELGTKAGQAKWVEVVGSGIVKGSVLEKLGISSKEYNGWAFGFGLERLAIISMELPDIRLLWSEDERVKRQLHLGNKFKEVSKFPPITRDISFVVRKDFVPNNYFDLIRDLGGDLVEEVQLLDKYENEEKFGSDKISYTYRIIYRSNERTLATEEIDPIQEKIYQETAKQFRAEVR